MEISNKTLALFLVGAIVVSLAGTIISLNKLDALSTTGLVADTGTAQLTVQSVGSIKFAIDTVDFGTGSVNTSGGNQVCVLTINDSSTITRIGCLNFNSANAAGDTFIIENDGNEYLNVTLNSTDNADDLVAGSASLNAFQWTISNNESNSCVGTRGVTTWTEITKVDTNVCTNLSYVDTSDTLRVGLNISIPYDAALGVRTATLTVTGTEFA